jgi:FlaA1/EpsC-like NDP-sugar epimerase
MLFRLLSGLKILPRWIIVLIDIMLILLSTLFAYSLRFNFEVAELYRVNFLYGALFFTICGTISVILTRSYQGIIRFTSLQDGIRIFGSSTLAALIALTFQLIAFRNPTLFILPISVLLISYSFVVISLISYRVLVKYLFSYYTQNYRKRINVALFGAGNSGRITYQILDFDKDSEYKVVSFLDDDPNKIGKKVNGIKILSAKHELENIVKEKNIKELIICIQDVSRERKSELVQNCLDLKVKVRTVPKAENWVQGTFSLNQIREVKVEDLLGRESIKLQEHNVLRELKDKHILVTGAAGSIGSEIARQIITYKPKLLVLLDQSETGLFDLRQEILKSEIDPEIEIVFMLADITNRQRMISIFSNYKPQVVFHAAAYKHVPMMEENPIEAINCNIFGTIGLAELSRNYCVDKFVMVSTDKAVNPTNVMGASKRVAEIYVQALNNFLSKNQGSDGTHFITTRFGNVLGSSGSVIPIFRKQIEEGGPITVTHAEISRYFMTIPEACYLVLEAGAIGKGGEIYMFDMGKPVKILELAKLMVKLYGLPEDAIQIKFTGLRPGEKLEEELFTLNETTLPTHHPKITIAKVAEYDYEHVLLLLSNLESDLNKLDDFGLVKAIKEIVPEYKSNASRFSVLDQDRSQLELENKSRLGS